MSVVLDDRHVVHDGIEVHVRVDRGELVLKGGTYLTDRAAVCAPHAGCGDLDLHVAAGSYFFPVGRQDARTGHASFDDRYIVKANDLDALRYWFGALEAEAMLATYDPHALDPFALHVSSSHVRLTASTDRSVSAASARAPGGLDFSIGAALLDHRRADAITDGIAVRWGAVPCLVTGIDRAVAAAATLAGRGARLAAGWRELLAPLGVVEAGAVWRTDEAYAVVLERGRTRVRVDFPWRLAPLRRRGLRTRLRVPWPDHGAAVVTRRPRAAPWWWSWRSRPRLAGGRRLALSSPWQGVAREAPALAALPRLGPALDALGVDWLLAGEGTLAVGWERIVDERESLDAAATQLERWSEHVARATGPYR